MLAKIVQIGSSKGIRIPKAVLQQCQFLSEVTLRVDKKRLIIESAPDEVRKGWRESFRTANKSVKDSEKPMSFQNKFDQEEWEW